MRFAIELQARRRVAVLAVGLTLGGGAAFGGLAGQLGALHASAAMATAAFFVVTQVRTLERLEHRWEQEALAADHALERLMLSEEEEG